MERRRSGHIPAFGNWDYANDLPITQYFESARQAGLIRFCHHPTTTTHTVVVSSQKKRGSQVAGRRRNTSSNLTTAAEAAAAAQVKEESKVVKSQQHQHQHQHQQPQPQPQKKHMYGNQKKIINRKNTSNSFKPEPEPVVDQDLYKIPPHLLHTSKRKKMLGFLSRCLGPGCTV